MTLLYKVLRSENSEENSEESRLLTGANLVLRQASGPPLRWGWVFLERTRILSGIKFTTQFIEIFVVETKRFVSSTVHVILMRQTCGQRSSRAAESKRRALGNDFFERICYMFPRSKCRGDRDLGLCTTSGLALQEPKRNGKFRGENVFRRRKNRIFPTSKHVFPPDFAIALRFSKCKYRSCAQT